MENPKEQAEQRVNFIGDTPNPHTHDNGNNGFNHFQPLPAVDSGYALNHSICRLPRKRPWHHSNQGTSPGTTNFLSLFYLFITEILFAFLLADQVDGSCHVKVYVAPVPRTASEADIRLVFEGHGTIVEVVLLKDKRTGVRQGSCFVKYATFDEADRAIKALSNQYTFPGESFPVVVKFADRELERLEVADKVFVSSINKEASKKEIEEIFSPYGHVEDIFIAHSRGYAFVKFSNREMASAAIKGLNRIFTMRVKLFYLIDTYYSVHFRLLAKGCDHPLIVRFADPKKPKTGES
ncbi:Flowering time control protein FCA, partial [Mucuna pruriens]